jgi:hypothetical protein
MVCPVRIVASVSQIALPAATVLGGALAAKPAIQKQRAPIAAKIQAPKRVKIMAPDPNFSLKWQSSKRKVDLMDGST